MRLLCGSGGCGRSAIYISFEQYIKEEQWYIWEFNSMILDLLHWIFSSSKCDIILWQPFWLQGKCYIR